MPGRRATLLALAAAGALAVVGAGALALAGRGDDQPYAKPRGRTVDVRLDEYRIVPRRIEVPAGRVRLLAHNKGILTHNLVVVQFERPLGDEQEREYARTPTAQPGATVSTSVTLEPGKYRLICSIANHDNLGQYGELKAVPGGSGP